MDDPEVQPSRKLDDNSGELFPQMPSDATTATDLWERVGQAAQAGPFADQHNTSEVASIESEGAGDPHTPQQDGHPLPSTSESAISRENDLSIMDTPRMSTTELASLPADTVPEEATAAVMENLHQRLNNAVTVSGRDESLGSANSNDTNCEDPFADPEPEHANGIRSVERGATVTPNPASGIIPEDDISETDSRLSRPSILPSGMQTPVAPPRAVRFAPDSQLSTASTLPSGMQTPVAPLLRTVHFAPPVARAQTTPAPTSRPELRAENNQALDAPSQFYIRPELTAEQNQALNLPSKFYIRDQTIDALVRPHHLKSHLLLLNAFWMLRQTVESMDEHPVSPFPEDKEKRWSWFVGFAVERFAAWSESLVHEDTQRSQHEIIPPLDVLMVWHSYLLNPGWYAEDCNRVPALRNLERIGARVFAPSLIHQLVIIIHEPVTDIRREVWNMKTQSRPFDVFDDAKQNQLKHIWCPDCQEPILHPFMTPEGTGYLQQKFKVSCPNKFCYFYERHIMKSTLGARKLTEDLIRPDADLRRSLIAGTFWSPKWPMEVRVPRATRIKDKILKTKRFHCPDEFADESLIPLILQRNTNPSLHNYRLTGRDGFINEGWALSLLWRHEFSLHRIIDGIHGRLMTMMSSSIDQLQDAEMLARRIHSAYTDGNIFSVDLVLRQSTFVEKMHNLGWSKLDFRDHPERNIILHHCVARYHGFLDLYASTTLPCLVPTLDIDLAWHTHQLFGPRYHIACMKHCRRLIDHNDKAEESRLSAAFDETCRAWKTRFDIDYISCGCPVPGTTRNQFWGLGGSRAKESAIYTGFLVPLPHRDPSVMAGTHPSDHDAFYNNRAAGVSDKNRAARLEKRAKKLGEKGKATKGLNFKKGKYSEQALERVHGPAFLAPIPGWYYSSNEEDGSWTGYAAHMLDSQPAGEINSVPTGLRHYTEPACLAGSEWMDGL